jgi:putative ABC transport system ATP-binding protein
MYRLEDVTKVYAKRGQSVCALDTTSLAVPKGDYVAIVGASGSGKTTLLSILGGMLTPSAGRVWLDDASLYELPVARRAAARREKIGFVFQTFNLVPYLSAIENVELPLYLAGLSKTDQQHRARCLLERVGLGDRLDHKPSELSVGQQQRVALARTVANNPLVILADEPTGNLDPESRENVLNFFDELHEEQRTLVMVTHDTVAAARAQRRLTLRNGTVSPHGDEAARAA